MRLKNLFNNIYSSVTPPPYSQLFFVSDRANWVLKWEMHEIRCIADQLGITTVMTEGVGVLRQAVFFSSKYILLKPWLYLSGSSKISLPYFHGYLKSDNPVFNTCYNNLKKHHHKIARIQVSHSYMRDIIMESGIDPGKVFLIPIAINGDFFQKQSELSKRDARKYYGIPQDAVIVGSFQKDGNGWGEGMEPKRIKGPDVFLKTVGILRESVPGLFVLLSGPARGFVKKGLEKLKIPYKHIYLEHYPDINRLYQCLDLYVIASREEGGPKAVLESMVCGIPLVTTSVGQAMDLVEHGGNGMMVEPEDAEGLSFCSEKVLSDSLLRDKITNNGIITARENTYTSHIPLWKEFFSNFVI